MAARGDDDGAVRATYERCRAIVAAEVRSSMMGWIFPVRVRRALCEGLFFAHTDGAGGELVGFAMCRRLVRSNILSLDKIGVDARFRRQGIGRALVCRVKAVGLPVRVDVVAANAPAVAFYMREGFVRVGGKALGKGRIDVSVMMWTNN